MAITLSHGGPTIYRSSERSRHVLVGTVQGVVDPERDAAGPGWRVARRTLPGKHIHALLIEPDTQLAARWHRQPRDRDLDPERVREVEIDLGIAQELPRGDRH